MADACGHTPVTDEEANVLILSNDQGFVVKLMMRRALGQRRWRPRSRAFYFGTELELEPQVTEAPRAPIFPKAFVKIRHSSRYQGIARLKKDSKFCAFYYNSAQREPLFLPCCELLGSKVSALSRKLARLAHLLTLSG